MSLIFIFPEAVRTATLPQNAGGILSQLLGSTQVRSQKKRKNQQGRNHSLHGPRQGVNLTHETESSYESARLTSPG